MRDWTAYVRARLTLDRLPPERAERIVREVADQLAELHADALARGMRQPDADAYACAQVTDWTRLAEDVMRADRPQARSRLDQLTDRAETSARRAFAGGPMLLAAQILRDGRHAVRQLVRTPVFTMVAIATIGLGVGATTAVFSVVNGVLLRPLPFADPAALVRVHEVVPEYGQFLVAPATFLDWREENQVFERLVAYVTPTETLTGGAGDPERVDAALVSWDTFEALGVTPALGAGFSAVHDRPGGPAVMLISHGLWQRRFGGDAAIVGRSVPVGGTPVTVLGVMPADFRFPSGTTELWRPLAYDPANAPRGAHFLAVIGRLKPGVSRDRADVEMKTISERLALRYPDQSANESASITALHQFVVGPVQRLLLTLFAAVAVVLAIACVNVANLLLVRGSARQRELAVRAALGAGRRRLAGQMLVEGLVLAGAGGALGLALAYSAMAPLQSLAGASLPRVAEIRVDLPVLLFTLTASVVTGLVFGLIPAWHASSIQPSGVLRDGARGSSHSRAHWVRSGLIVVEVALSIVLLVGAMLLWRSFTRLTNVDPGFEPDSVLAFQVALPRARFPEDANRVAFLDRLRERLTAQPGVEAVGMVHALPLRGNYGLSFQVVDRPRPLNGGPSAGYRVIDPGYFRALRIPLLRGRWFTSRDTSAAQKVAIVDESFAARHFSGEDPIGRALEIRNGDGGVYRIVGVAGNVRHGALDAAPAPTMYVPYAQDAFSSMWITVRTTSRPEVLAGPVKQILRELDDQVPAFAMAPLSAIVDESVGPQRFTTLLGAVFAGVALLLATVGLYGVVAYSVSRRTREIGVRIAMGATRGDVVRLVVGSGLKLAAVGIVIGLSSGAVVAGFVEALLFEVTSLDPVSYVVTAGILVLVTVAACYVPARRAACVDPIIALDAE